MQAFAEKIGLNRTIMALSFARLGDAIGNSILFVIIPLYVSKLPSPWFPMSDSARAGLLISIFGFVNVLMQPIGGGLSDRLQRRKIFIIGGLSLVGLGTLSFIFATRFVHLILLRSIQGVGVAMTIPAVLAIMTTASKHESRGGSMGIYSTMRMVGLSIGPVIGGYLIDHASFNASFFAGGAFIFIGILMVQLWVKEPPRSKEPPKASIKSRLIDPDLINKGMLSLGFASFLIAFSFSIVTPLEQEFNTRLGQGALGFGFSFTALLVSRLIFQIPFGRLSDTRGRKLFIIPGLILIAVSTVLLGFVQTTFQMIIVRVFQGIASAAIASPVFALAGDLSKKGSEGRQMSIITIGFGLGIASAPLLAGLLVSVSFQMPFIIGGVLAILASWVVSRYAPETVFPENKKQSAESHSSG